MDGWNHQFTGCELGQIPRDGEEQRSQACYSPGDCEELDPTW